MKRSVFSIFLACLFLGNNAIAQDLAKEYQEVANIFSAALTNADAKSLAPLFMADCVFTDYEGTTINGKKNIVKYYEERMQRVSYQNLKIVMEEVVDIGNGNALGRGHYTATLVIEGKDAMKIKGHFQNVVKKQDGNWKIYRHLASVLPPSVS